MVSFTKSNFPQLLKLLGKNPRKPKKKDGYIPDWECDDAIYEVKTRNWTTGGSAGEKVLGVMYKYSDIPYYLLKKYLEEKISNVDFPSPLHIPFVQNSFL